MPAASYVCDNFGGGEWSRLSQGRITSKEYRTAMNVCVNGFPIDGGAWVRRPGFNFAGLTRNGQPGKLISYTFEEAAPYTMEFTTAVLRMREGTTLVSTNDDATVSTISTASPAKVATTAAHGWTGVVQVMFGNLLTATPLLKNRQFVATVTSTTEFTLTDPVSGAAIDGSTLGTNPVSATVSRILEIATPYLATDWPTLRSVQAETSAVLLTGAKQPYVLSVDSEPTADAFGEFSLDAALFKDGPYLDPVLGGALINPSAATAGLVNLTLSFAAWDATRAYAVGDFVTYSSVNYEALTGENVNLQPDTHASNWAQVSAGVAIGPNGFLATDVGRLMRLYSNPADYVAATTYALGASVMYAGIPYRAVVGSNTGNTPGVDPAKWAIDLTAARWTWGRISSILNTIDRALAGSATIGDMTSGSNVFDGITSQTTQAGAHSTASSCYVGKNYSASIADQKIASAVVYPAAPGGTYPVADGGFNDGFDTGLQASGGGTGTHAVASMVTINLRGKATLPASRSDGTLLGTTGSILGSSGIQTILSSDTTTAWKYIWVELIVDSQEEYPSFTTHTPSYNLGIAELQFVKPATSGTSGDGVTIQILGDALLNTVAISKFRMGIYSDTTGWPKNGTYHEGRLWLSGVVGNRIDSSMSNGVADAAVNFAPTAADGQVAANHGISYTFNSEDVNIIRWMKSEQQGIICGTQAGEWLVQPSTGNSGITPTNIQAHKITKVGCADIEPARAELTLVLVQRYKHKLVEYFADVFSGKFAAPNLSADASHLATRGIEQIAYQQMLTPIVWARCTDGTLIGMTYKRESLMSSQGPTFNGWHQHTLGSGRDVESMCVGPSAAGYLTDEGVLDTLAIITNDPDTDVRHVEFLTNIFEEQAPNTAAWFVDDATNDVNYAEATVGGRTGLTITGLWHLNAETVAVFAGGYDAGDFLVTNGSCFVPYDTILTAAFVTAFAGAMPVVVGFTYTSQGQIVRPATAVETGTRNGPGFGKERRQQYLAALLESTAAISFGTDFTTTLKAALFETPGGTRYAANTLFSGMFRMPLTDGYSLDSMLAWQVSRPYPANVAALGGFIHGQDL